MQYQVTRSNRRTVSRGADDDEAAPMTEDSGLVKLELDADVAKLLDPSSGHSPKLGTMTSSQVGYQWHGENASGKQILTCLWYLLRYRLVIA